MDYGILRQFIISFSVSKIPFIYLMAPVDFTNDGNTMHGVI